MADSPISVDTAPLVIGATGGSGTRVIAAIARRAGYALGTNLNNAGDALDFLPFYDEWINRYSEADLRSRALPAVEAERMQQDFERVLGQHIDGLGSSGQRWGWKTPRSIYLLPFLHSRFGSMRFIHVLRDGRDMAVSRNQVQLHKHGSAFLTLRERFVPAPVRSILLWHRVNLRAADYAATHLGDDGLIVRFEDLCHSPVPTTDRIIRFLGGDLDAEQVAREEISPPDSIGRWRDQPDALKRKLNNAAEDSLRRFGYLD